MMAMKRWNKCKNRVLTRMLTWLGIGSSAMLFMACYGPAPKNYQPEPYGIGEDTVELMAEDSLEVVEQADSVAVVDEQR